MSSISLRAFSDQFMTIAFGFKPTTDEEEEVTIKIRPDGTAMDWSSYQPNANYHIDIDMNGKDKWTIDNSIKKIIAHFLVHNVAFRFKNSTRTGFVNVIDALVKALEQYVLPDSFA